MPMIIWSTAVRAKIVRIVQVMQIYLRRSNGKFRQALSIVMRPQYYSVPRRHRRRQASPPVRLVIQPRRHHHRIESNPIDIHIIHRRRPTTISVWIWNRCTSNRPWSKTSSSLDFVLVTLRSDCWEMVISCRKRRVNRRTNLHCRPIPIRWVISRRILLSYPMRRRRPRTITRFPVRIRFRSRKPRQTRSPANRCRLLPISRRSEVNWPRRQWLTRWKSQHHWPERIRIERRNASICLPNSRDDRRPSQTNDKPALVSSVLFPRSVLSAMIVNLFLFIWEQCVSGTVLSRLVLNIRFSLFSLSSRSCSLRVCVCVYWNNNQISTISFFSVLFLFTIMMWLKNPLSLSHSLSFDSIIGY